MKINYDKMADAAYILIKKGTVKKTVHLAHLIHADLDKNGKVLGIEILKASLTFKKTKSLQPTFSVPVSVIA